MTRRIKRPGNASGMPRLLNTCLPQFTVAQLQAKTPDIGHLVMVTDGAANKRLAIGADVWRYADGAAV